MAALRLREYATAISAPRSRPLPRPRMPPVIEIFGVRYQKGTLKMNWLRVSLNLSLFVEDQSDQNT